MKRIALFQQAILTILQDEATYYKGTTNPLNLLVIADQERHHYQLLMQGWEGDRYTFQCLLHFDIIDSKIWIQWNDTELPAEQELLKAGIRADEIVIGNRHPETRKFRAFAVG